MKNITKLFAIAIAVLGFSITSFAQTTATATSNASATILMPITITNTTPMNFGTIGSAATASTVVLDYSDGRTVTGGATLFTVGAPAKSGVFAITGTPNATFAITLPVAPITITSPSSATMTVTTFQSNLGATSSITAAGTKALLVSATLNLAANQAAGTYTGAYSVRVDYN